MSDFCFSRDNEHFYGSCDSREAALAQGIEESRDDANGPPAMIYTGVAVYFGGWHVWADSVIEQMQEQAWEECGEHSEGWLDDANKEQVEELEAALNAVVEEWLQKHKLTPHFFSVRDIESHFIPTQSTGAHHAD